MNIAVYCSSVDNLPAHWQQTAAAVGRWIGAHGESMVYGGVDAGLMRIAAEGVRTAGGKVVGVVPVRRKLDASPLNDVQVPTSDLNDRKGVMQLLSDIFVVLPGGYGTLDEFSTSFSYINFTRQLNKQIIIYNPDGIYDLLLNHLQLMVDRGLMCRECADVIKVTRSEAETIKALDEFYETYDPHIYTPGNHV